MTTKMISKEDLFRVRLDEDDVEIPSLNGSVRVRALSRSEVMKIQGVELPAEVMEQKLLSTALVDPKLSEKEVKAWQEACPALELEEVTNRIMELSGMKKESAKEAMKSFPESS